MFMWDDGDDDKIKQQMCEHNVCHLILNSRWAKWKLKYLSGIILLTQYK